MSALRRLFKRHSRLLAVVLIYGVLLNLPYWLAASAFDFQNSGYFALEYALFGILALYAWPVISIPLLIALMATDILWGICHSYFLSVRAILLNIGSMDSIPAARQIEIGCITIAAFALVWVVVKARHWITPRQRGTAVLVLLGFVIFAQSYDMFRLIFANGSAKTVTRLVSGLRKPISDVASEQGPSLARNPVVRLIHLEQFEWGLHRIGATDAATNHPMSRAADVALRDSLLGNASPSTAPNVVLILTEAWGESTQPSLNAALLAPYRAAGITSRYKIETGTVPFFSSTVPGEIRELCGNTLAFHVLDASPDELKHCLPATFAARGYRTIALHGMSGNMFSRSEWYPKMGFQEILFHDGLRKQGLPDCKTAFLGTCDAAIADWIAVRLADPARPPTFIHWTTLGSHLPVLVPAGLPNPAPCTAVLQLSDNTPLCSWYQLEMNVHTAVARAAASNLARKTIFIVVGDHVPPFGDRKIMERFSRQVVPYVVLIPR